MRIRRNDAAESPLSLLLSLSAVMLWPLENREREGMRGGASALLVSIQPILMLIRG